jgi:hypothetical protein
MNFTKQTKITVVGVSDNPEKYGHKIFRDLLKSGYQITGVNPKGGSILDQTIYTSLDKIPEKPELLLVVVPPTIGLSVLEKARDLKIENIWLQPGAESEELIQFAKDNNLNLTHTACFMVDNHVW